LEITITFCLGLVFALIGVIPPGLLNMTAAKISLKDGHTRGLVFSSGVCVVVIFQTYIALTFAKYLSKHPDVVDILQRVALVIFILITVYFLLLAKKEVKPHKEPNIKSKKSRFFQGVFLSALNVFPIPYQAYMGTTLAAASLIKLDTTNIWSYVSGAASGTFIMLYVYVFLFEKINSRKIKSQKNINLIIGSITGLISIFTLINIIKDS